MQSISDYSFGRVKIGDAVYNEDLALCDDEILAPWVRGAGHKLSIDDLEWLLARKPKVIVVGTGAFGRVAISDDVAPHLRERGIDLVTNATAKAIDAYGELSGKGEKIGCCLHLSC